MLNYMKYIKKFNENKNISRELEIKMLAGDLNSYKHISMTDDSFTFDYHIRQQDSIKSKLEGITTKELFDLYFMLDDNGIYNLTRLFRFVFNDLEKEHNSKPDLNIWDFRKVKDLYFKK
jgi:hypothetical protein